MLSSVKDKTALVTGGAKGIGFACAVELLKNDAKSVAILDLPTANGEEAVAKLEKQFGKGHAIFIPCDVTIPEQLESAFKKAFDTFNGVDIVINNAGIMNDKEWEKMIDVNVTALIRASLLTLELMGKHKGGKGGTMVNVSSICGLRSHGMIPIYVATKHAVVGFSRSLREHYNKTGVRVLIMCPGATDTPLMNDKSDKYIDVVDLDYAHESMHNLPCQSSECVGRAMVDLIERGENGTICVSEGGKPGHFVDFPTYHTLLKPM